MKDKAIIIMHYADGRTEDLEVPLNITANDFILAVSKIYSVELKQNKNYYYLRCDNPKALLRGNKLLGDYSLRDGTEIWLWHE